MEKKHLLLLLWFIPLILYHSDRGEGPDCIIYKRIARSVWEERHLNILSETEDAGEPLQLTRTHHAPIHQVIGGSVFLLPAIALTESSFYRSTILPLLSGRFSSQPHQESLWIGFIAWLLGFWTCLLTYRVARVYFSARSSAVAVALCALGGPLLVYVAELPCQCNLPGAFLAALIIYIYHFSDRRSSLSWLLLGSVWGFGTFVRNEFFFWGILPVYGLLREIFEKEGWRNIAIHTICLAGSALLMAAPNFIIRLILYGNLRSAYYILFDLNFITELPYMLFGPRNGLFSFWPILLMALFGYAVGFKKNPGVFHSIFIIVLIEIGLFGLKLFWAGELGRSFGQRNILIVLPCFMLFLARLFEEKNKFFKLLVLLGVGCVLWSGLLFAFYGNAWVLEDGSTGFFMANNIPDMLSSLRQYGGPTLPEMVSFFLLPKHDKIWWILPAFATVLMTIILLQKTLPRSFFFHSLLVGFLLFIIAALIFLKDAGRRGERFFQAFQDRNPDTEFVYNRTQEIDGEVVGCMLDCVAYFLEREKVEKAVYFRDKTAAFLQREAPDQVRNFNEMCEALLIRKEMGWRRLIPEQDHSAVLRWYRQYRQAPPI